MRKTMLKCTGCQRREPFFFRPYSGQRLCKKCFTEAVEKKVRATIAKHGMFSFNDKIAVAVSGGKDSLSLLYILTKMAKLRPKASIVAVTVDEGIRGYRNEALEMAAAKCEELGIVQHIVSFKELYGYTLDEIVAETQRKGNNEL